MGGGFWGGGRWDGTRGQGADGLAQDGLNIYLVYSDFVIFSLFFVRSGFRWPNRVAMFFFNALCAKRSHGYTKQALPGTHLKLWGALSNVTMPFSRK